MKEITTNVTNEQVTFGIQLDNLVQRHHDFLEFQHAKNGIGEQFPQLRGHEKYMVELLGKAIVERIRLMDDMGHGGLAREIVAARRACIISKSDRSRRQ